MTLVATEHQMITVRIIQGIGAAMIYGTAIAILTAVFPPGERGRALGIYITSVYLGLSLGPFLGGVLTDQFGWRSIFYINVPIAIAAAILIVWKLRGEWAECRGEKFDLAGSLIYSVALVSLMYGFSVLPDISGEVPVVAVLFWSVFLSGSSSASHTRSSTCSYFSKAGSLHFRI